MTLSTLDLGLLFFHFLGSPACKLEIWQFHPWVVQLKFPMTPSLRLHRWSLYGLLSVIFFSLFWWRHHCDPCVIYNQLFSSILVATYHDSLFSSWWLLSDYFLDLSCNSSLLSSSLSAVNLLIVFFSNFFTDLYDFGCRFDRL